MKRLFLGIAAGGTTVMLAQRSMIAYPRSRGWVGRAARRPVRAVRHQSDGT